MSDEIRSGERANNFLLTISSNYLYCLYYLFGIIIALILSYHSMAGIIITVCTTSHDEKRSQDFPIAPFSDRHRGHIKHGMASPPPSS
jgi:hypothetical protein